ncbi:MAG: restriction endonuclease [Euryarchaeota archaeon HGW-Euryarchaeota-1]|nr:MAG: restriction endonuclease [Euryarchaeota archaeon HGW-Euryarchaeota-1]
MNLKFNKSLAYQYKSNSQKARVITESWVGNNIFCPFCGSTLKHHENNKPVGDFYCPKCDEDFELKSKKGSIGRKIINGSYSAKIRRINGDKNPNFFVLAYDIVDFSVLNFFVIPNHFFVTKLIEKRKPLSKTARRAGWIGSNILLNLIPNSGKIFYIKNREIKDKDVVLKQFKKTIFLRKQKGELKGWLLDVMACIDKLKKEEFTLQEVYAFEDELKAKHPKNKHVKDKIRQQLQFLRDKGYLKFLEKGVYKTT